MAKWDDPTLPYDQKEKVGKQMVALQKRLEHEIKVRENDTPKIEALEKKFNHLKIMAETTN